MWVWFNATFTSINSLNFAVFLAVHFFLSFYGFYRGIYNMYLCFFIHFNHIIALPLFDMLRDFHFNERSEVYTSHMQSQLHLLPSYYIL